MRKLEKPKQLSKEAWKRFLEREIERRYEELAILYFSKIPRDLLLKEGLPKKPESLKSLDLKKYKDLFVEFLNYPWFSLFSSRMEGFPIGSFEEELERCQKKSSRKG